MEKISILICIPCYQGLCHIEPMKQLVKLTHLLVSQNIEYELFTLSNESLISRARNICATYFISKTSHTHLFFLDNDIIFSPCDVLKLLQHNKHIIAGLYPKKCLNFEKIMQNIENIHSLDDLILASSSKIGTFIDKKHPSLMSYVPTGFLLIQRIVIETLSNSQSLCYINDVVNYTEYTNNNKAFNFFQSGIFNKQFFSEDFGFCFICRNSKFDIYSDTSINLKHIGHLQF